MHTIVRPQRRYLGDVLGSSGWSGGGGKGDNETGAWLLQRIDGERAAVQQYDLVRQVKTQPDTLCVPVSARLVKTLENTLTFAVINARSLIGDADLNAVEVPALDTEVDTAAGRTAGDRIREQDREHLSDSTGIEARLRLLKAAEDDVMGNR